MPNKDPVKRIAQQNDWQDRARRRGYNVALYRRRKAKEANEAVLRSAIEDILANKKLTVDQITYYLRLALRNAPEVGKPKDYLPKAHTYVPRPQKLMPCGHPRTKVATSSEGTSYCTECAREAGMNV